MPERIVVLDGYALNPGDLDWTELEKLGGVTIYERTGEAQVAERAAGASVVLTNKSPLRAPTIDALPDLRFIGVLATGYDIVDVKAAAERRIPVSNVPTYGTASVAQFAFALLLELCHRVQQHADDVKAGGWTRRAEWSYHLTPQVELAGKTMGLIGYGRIGRQTATIARAMGMRVIAFDPAMKDEEGVEPVELDELLKQSDVVSLHCPLTEENRGLINRERVNLMKRSAFLINTSRGPLVVEGDLAEALNSGRIAGAALDVIPVEPPTQPSPLFTSRNTIVTPHIAWSTREARGRLMQTAVDNVRAFFNGHPQNVVNSF